MRPAALASITILAAAAIAVAGCSSAKSGKALPAPDPSLTTKVSATSMGGSSDGLTGLKACSLLVDAEAQQVIPGAGGHEELGEQGGSGTSACGWTKRVGGNTPGHSLGITVRPVQGIKDIVLVSGEQMSSTKTSEGRPAVIQKNALGDRSCAVSIAVGVGRVDIFDASQGPGGDTNGACAVVGKVSEYVEPRLPKG